MKATTLLLAGALIGLALVSIPFDDSPVGTAQAYVCTWDGTTEGLKPYAQCEQGRVECWVENGVCPR